MQITKKLILISSLILFSNAALASPGRLNKEGCHTDKETKTYHCHDKTTGKSTKTKKEGKSAKKSGKKAVKKAESKKKVEEVEIENTDIQE